ncbi:hypothetical protein [Streptomyces sp. ID05-18]|uniref:hypothetical protein n=1 Tax=Streptomyces sp. ID05-18 TaxID=3028662 RepID=UPI0029B22717|nr:hypothetical protein [Streptomyces sp. ID05-18]MDX3488465.1 hypothetical protein [Streptomyces sp. ID05-18]
MSSSIPRRPSTPEQFQKGRELAARVDLFGSPAVRSLWEAVTAAMGDFNMHVVEGGYLERSFNETYLPDNITEPRFVELKAAMDKAKAELVKRLRHEIDVDEHLKP